MPVTGDGALAAVIARADFVRSVVQRRSARAYIGHPPLRSSSRGTPPALHEDRYARLRSDLLMLALITTALLLGAVGVLAGCGSEEPVALPSSGRAYRTLSDDERLAVAASCRDRAAARATGVASEQLERVDARALRDHLDMAFRMIREQPRPVAELCARRLPFVTPGLDLRFDGAMNSGDAYTYETESNRPLTIRGVVSPARSGTVTVRREFGSKQSFRAPIGPDGHFTLPTLRLRKVADNSFILDFDAPPNAPRKAYFSAICLDCLAGAPPPSTSS